MIGGVAHERKEEDRMMGIKKAADSRFMKIGTLAFFIIRRNGGLLRQPFI
jgi:hypothetical protein